jgi:hypothetical protein
MTELLLQVLSIDGDKQLISNIDECLPRSKQESAKVESLRTDKNNFLFLYFMQTLWNLAFTEANRKRIKDANGISILQKIQHETRDTVLQANLAGVLYMFEKHDQTTHEQYYLRHAIFLKQKKKNAYLILRTRNQHVMLSYNWANQAVVIRLAQSLKSHGYAVWLDVEQMAGSTLVASTVFYFFYLFFLLPPFLFFHFFFSTFLFPLQWQVR